jgi:hypothetical protein
MMVLEGRLSGRRSSGDNQAPAPSSFLSMAFRDISFVKFVQWRQVL